LRASETRHLVERLEGQQTPLRCDASGLQLTAMTKTQLRELKALLAILANRLPDDALDETTRVVLYRVQSLADEGMHRAAARPSMHQAG
jgi:hypothetical protein